MYVVNVVGISTLSCSLTTLSNVPISLILQHNKVPVLAAAFHLRCPSQDLAIQHSLHQSKLMPEKDAKKQRTKPIKREKSKKYLFILALVSSPFSTNTRSIMPLYFAYILFRFYTHIPFWETNKIRFHTYTHTIKETKGDQHQKKRKRWRVGGTTLTVASIIVIIIII